MISEYERMLKKEWRKNVLKFTQTKGLEPTTALTNGTRTHNHTEQFG